MSHNDDRGHNRSTHSRDSAADRSSYHPERRRHDDHYQSQHDRPYYKRPPLNHRYQHYHAEFPDADQRRAFDIQPQSAEQMFPPNQYAFHSEQALRFNPPHHVMINQHTIPPFHDYTMSQTPGLPFMDPKQMFPIPPMSEPYLAGPMTNDYTASVMSEQLSASALDRLQLPPDKITETGIIPDKPYYQLPAGLMVPLIPGNQLDYKPINQADLRLPFPKFPDESFLKTIDAYYSDTKKLRDNDGWDRKFIDTFRKQKEALGLLAFS